MLLPPRFIKNVRTIHLYLGVFTAPALFFFAFTGGLQTFGLHEASRDGSYQPPAWLASMSQMHKKQTFEHSNHRPSQAQATLPSVTPAASTAVSEKRAAGARPADASRAPRKTLLPMKIFFALVATGLFISTLTGLYMAWRLSRSPRTIITVFAAGILVPAILALL